MQIFRGEREKDEKEVSMKNSTGKSEPCPDGMELILFKWSPNDLSPEEYDRIVLQLEKFSSCSKKLEELEELFGIEEFPEFAPLWESEEVKCPTSLTDLAARYPSPVAKVVDLKKFRNWFLKTGKHLYDLLNVGKISFEEMQLSTVRLNPVSVQTFDSLVDEIQQAMDEGKFLEAAKRLGRELDEKVLAKDLQPDLRRKLVYLEGYCYLNAGYPGKARSLLEGIIDENTDPSVYWTFMIVCLQLDDLDTASRHLKLLAGLNSEYGRKAAEILEEISGQLR